ncbi:CRISPR-associated endoribonuclease Cas6 [Desulfoscipio gibsoniae]
MFQKIILQCEYADEQRGSYQWGSIFHGVLMEAIPSEIAEHLHQIQLRPFSQFVLPGTERQLNWQIGLWDTAIANHIIESVMPLTEIDLKQKGLRLKVMETKRLIQSKEEYFKRFFTSPDPCRRFEIIFLTPCTHKRDGRYALFPSSELIIQNLYLRYNTYIDDFSLEDPEAMQHLVKHMHIVRYALHSAVYYLEKTKITGYLGKITLVISGPEQIARLGGALLSFAEYSGLGIKTALGMGGVRLREIVRRE